MMGRWAAITPILGNLDQVMDHSRGSVWHSVGSQTCRYPQPSHRIATLDLDHTLGVSGPDRRNTR
jgi:hypothetical protein